MSSFSIGREKEKERVFPFFFFSFGIVQYRQNEHNQLVPLLQLTSPSLREKKKKREKGFDELHEE
jgi:hypothetical protein